MPDLDCVGCFTTMWNLFNCNRGDFACVNAKMVEPERVLEAVFSFVGHVYPKTPARMWNPDAEMVTTGSTPWRIPTEPSALDPAPAEESAVAGRDAEQVGHGNGMLLAQAETELDRPSSGPSSVNLGEVLAIIRSL